MEVASKTYKKASRKTSLGVEVNDAPKNKISKQQYEYALARIEELLPLVDEDCSADDKNLVELSIVSDIVQEYEAAYYPIEKPKLGELIALAVEESGMTQKELAERIGVSPSRISDYISGRAEPTLKTARLLCLNLNITPEEMLGL